MQNWTSDINEGEWLSRISYIKVLSRVDDEFRVANESGFEWVISTAIIENECQSSSQYTEEKKTNQSELSRLLLEETRGSVVSVSFTKKQTPARVVNMLADIDTSLMSAKEMKTFASSLLVGEERHLVGYVVSCDPYGRIRMIDLKVEGSNRMRLVDPRTLSNVTFRGVKYTKK